jgi:chromosome segregation ATPase
MITEAAKKAQEISAQLKDDQELAAAAKTLADLVAKRTAELGNLKKAVEAKKVEITAQNTKIATVTKQMEAAQVALTASQKVVADKTVALKPLQEKYAATQAETVKATQSRDVVSKEVEAIRVQLAPLVGNEQASVVK